MVHFVRLIDKSLIRFFYLNIYYILLILSSVTFCVLLILFPEYVIKAAMFGLGFFLFLVSLNQILRYKKTLIKLHKAKDHYIKYGYNEAYFKNFKKTFCGRRIISYIVKTSKIDEKSNNN
jgi:hypothetical protein